MNILQENILDNRFLRLIDGLLKAGYCEQWTYHLTLSGTPQGGVVSPILANIYLDRLDKFVTDTLIPGYTQGERRKPHPEYTRLSNLGQYYRQAGRPDRAKELRRQAQAYPSVDPNDSDYRRLRYIRYADDFLLGLAGPRAEAEDLKERLATFLKTELNLALSDEKTLITHAQTGRARFLGYEIGLMQSQTKFDHQRRRSVNGKVGLYVPEDVIECKRKRFLRDGKAIHRAELVNDSEYDILIRYQWEYRGLVEYYAMAQNLYRLGYLRWAMETSLLKTLANKYRTTVVKMRKRLLDKQQTTHGPRKCLKITLPREGKRPLVAIFGGLSLKRRRNAAIKDQVLLPYIQRRSEVVDRLLRDQCEVCGATGKMEMHHIRRMADLNKKGRKEKPLWMQIMVARRRKTLAVCHECHMDIQYNRPKSKDKGYRRAG